MKWKTLYYQTYRKPNLFSFSMFSFDKVYLIIHWQSFSYAVFFLMPRTLPYISIVKMHRWIFHILSFKFSCQIDKIYCTFRKANLFCLFFSEEWSFPWFFFVPRLEDSKFYFIFRQYKFFRVETVEGGTTYCFF